MQSVIEILKAWQLHPFVDHFTVALILAGIVTDLVASLFSSRIWMRYMALTLMIAGAAAAVGSNLTGGWEADRVWDLVSGPGKDVLKRHAWWGDILPWVFAGLAVWRFGVQFFGFIAASRPIYLLAAIVGGVLIVYQGYLGGEMVYGYGVGTAPTGQAPGSATPAPSPQTGESTLPPQPVPSITPAAGPTMTPSATESAAPPSAMTASPSPSETPSPSPSASPSEQSSAAPSTGEGSPTPTASPPKNL
ncbi:MAG TPA: DUF2231 domain-containing protein [Candidatus Binataceae bacterium]|nr:DUF2231 domain-containing protein [Candidatus Binataceae bacterium]